MLTTEEINKIKTLRAEGKKLREIASIIPCNINTVHRWCLPYEPMGRKERNRRYWQKRKLKQAILDNVIGEGK